MQQKTYTYQSSKIFYRVVGSGTPVILIHGFAEDGDIWQNQIEFLKDHCQLIIPDLPGTGKSEMIAHMSIEGMAELIRSLLLYENIKACIMVGHSMGGYISLALAEKYPQIISSMALVHSSAFADSEEKKSNRLKSIEFVKKNGAFEFLKAVIVDLFTEDFYTNNRKIVDTQIEKAKLFTDEAIVAYYDAMINRPDRTAILKNFHKPILFIIGQHDKAVPFKDSMQQVHLPAQSHIHILRNSAHMGMWEEAKKINYVLLSLIQTI